MKKNKQSSGMINKEVNKKIILSIAGVISIYFVNIFIKGLQSPINELRKEIITLKEDNIKLNNKINELRKEVVIFDKSISNLSLSLDEISKRKRTNTQDIFFQIDYLKKEILEIYKNVPTNLKN